MSAVAFFGDGASNQGTTLESLNLAVDLEPAGDLRRGEQRLRRVDRRRRGRWPTDDIADRAAAFGMPGVIVDGFDFFAVHEAAGEAVARAREGGGPTLIEVKFTRYFGHFEGDQQPYRADEVGNARENLDCLKRLPRAASPTRAGSPTTSSTRSTARSPR